MKQKDIKLGMQIVFQRSYPLAIRKRFPWDIDGDDSPMHPKVTEYDYNQIGFVVGLRNVIMDNYRYRRLNPMADGTCESYYAEGTRENVVIVSKCLWRVSVIVRLCDIL